MEKKDYKYRFVLLFVLFVLGSLFGSIFESIVIFFQKSEWIRRSDLLVGPFSTLYGFGCVIYIVLLGKNSNRNIIKTFIYSSLLGGIFEYLSSLLFEVFFNLKFWDYSSYIMNIQGRTTIPIMMIWGILGTLLLKVIYPNLKKLIKKITINKIKPYVYVLLVFFVINMTLSYTIFFRTMLRNKGIDSFTLVGKMYDYYFDDEFMRKKYPILKDKI